MPFGLRIVDPSRLCAHSVPSEEEEDKKCVLHTIANNAIVGALLQLSSLVRHADDLFCDISDECQKVFERTDAISKKIKHLDEVISKLDAKQVVIRKYRYFVFMFRIFVCKTRALNMCLRPSWRNCRIYSNVTVYCRIPNKNIGKITKANLKAVPQLS